MDELEKVNAKYKEYLLMISSMTMDCLMGGITYETYQSNLEVAIRQMADNRARAAELRKQAKGETNG